MLPPPLTPVLALDGKSHWKFPVGHRPGSSIPAGGVLFDGVCRELSLAVFSFGQPAMLLSWVVWGCSGSCGVMAACPSLSRTLGFQAVEMTADGTLGYCCSSQLVSWQCLCPSCSCPWFPAPGNTTYGPPHAQLSLPLAGSVKAGMGKQQGGVLWLSSARGWEGLGLSRGLCSFDWQTWMMQREFYFFILPLKSMEAEG